MHRRGEGLKVVSYLQSSFPFKSKILEGKEDCTQTVFDLACALGIDVARL